MAQTAAEAVVEFMVTYGQDVTGCMDGQTLKEFLAFRRRLEEEELDEMDEANGNRVLMLDAGLDQLYFTYGKLVGLGFTARQIDAGFAEVHRSNMSKLDENGRPIFREDGKVLKGPNYTPPDLTKIACP